MSGAATKPMASRDIVPIDHAFSQYLFAFSSVCTKSCTDDQLGARSLSSTGLDFFATPAAANTFAQTIMASIETLMGADAINKFLQANQEAMEIQATVMGAKLPMMSVVVCVPPCAAIVTAALALCQQQKSHLTEWRVRIDHRNHCACCADITSALHRIEMIADTIADVESGNHRAKPCTDETLWITHIDRAWLDNILYNELEENRTPKPSKELGTNRHDYAGIRAMLTKTGRTDHTTVAVILGDVDNAGWIINSAPFPAVRRQPRAGEIFSLKMSHPFSGSYHRSFLGTFATTGALKRRRVDSPPPEGFKATNKRQTRTNNNSTVNQACPDELCPTVQDTVTSQLTISGHDQIWHNQVLGEIESVYALASSSSKVKAKNLKVVAILASKESQRRGARSDEGDGGLRARAKNVMRNMVNFWKPIERDERIRRRVAERQERLKAYLEKQEVEEGIVHSTKAQPESGPKDRNEMRRQESEDETANLWRWCPLRRVPTQVHLVEQNENSNTGRQINFVWPVRRRSDQFDYCASESKFRKWLEGVIIEKLHIPGPEQYVEVETDQKGWAHAGEWDEIHDEIRCFWPQTKTSWTVRVSRQSNKSGGNMAASSDENQSQEQSSGEDEEDGRVARHEELSMDDSGSEMETDDFIDSDFEEESDSGSELDSDSDYED
ncbi:putative DNA helicase ino80 [Gnomoniopsis smithogilvyi]|uniref:DNA helicase ino80 n=1 Tax=Gnomoniopsis smithogilvyi TaxID=1191159 RepID=A0A9W8Z3W7_9PEZI|nr:putative DNA helicase ino80 [Gnomoniopsis smithogilvyi]